MLDDVDIDPRFTCVSCGSRYIPKSKRHVRTCGEPRCQYAAHDAARRDRPAFKLATRERCAKWKRLNGGYTLARRALRRRGLLTSDTVRALVPLKGKGELSTAEALRAVGLDGLVRATLETTRSNPKTRRLVASAPAESDPWSLPSPAVPPVIAHAAEIRFSQRGIPRERVRDHFAARMLHGALHHALGVGHSLDRTPLWIVLPARRGDRLWLCSHDSALLDRLPRSVLLGSDEEAHDLAVHSRARIKSPPPREPGQYRARVLTRGPLALKKSNRTIERAEGESKRAARFGHIQLDPRDLSGTLERVAARIGVELPAKHIIARVVSHDLERIEDGVRVGGHWTTGGRPGTVDALIGVLDIECNAVGRWLLDAAALVGLGSRTSIGFGRVSAEDQ